MFKSVSQQLTDRKLYADPNLTLERLARKTGLPGRRISEAINRLENKNVSQFVNERRIAEACRLLMGTEDTVTQIMFAAGFQTKSNFNREFRRLMRASPSEWRERQLKNVINLKDAPP